MYRNGNFAIVDGGYFCACEYTEKSLSDSMQFYLN
jgi:hypothetical protein